MKFRHVLQPVIDLIDALTARVNNPGLVAKTANGNLLATDIGKTVTMTVAGANTLTIPPGLMSAGQVVRVVQTGAGATSIAAGAGVTLNGAGDAIAVGGQWTMKTIICRASNTYLVI